MDITFHDIDGQYLNIGDWCSVSHSSNNTGGGRRLLTFYSQVKLLPDGRIQPFDNFAFNQIHKIDFENIPKDAVYAKNGGYYVVYNGEESEPEDKIREYMLSYISFSHNRKFYSISFN